MAFPSIYHEDIMIFHKITSNYGLNIFFIDTQTSKELIQMDINKMMTK